MATIQNFIRLARITPCPLHRGEYPEDVEYNKKTFSEGDLIVTAGGKLRLFHVTTPENAEKILSDGGKMNDCPVGFNGRSTGPAFWMNAVPWLPYGIDASHPTWFETKDMEVLAMDMDGEILDWVNKAEWEWTWQFLQIPIRDESLITPDRFFRIDASDFMHYRDQPDLMKYISNAIDEGYTPEGSYLHRIKRQFNAMVDIDKMLGEGKFDDA